MGIGYHEVALQCCSVTMLQCVQQIEDLVYQRRKAALWHDPTPSIIIIDHPHLIPLNLNLILTLNLTPCANAQQLDENDDKNMKMQTGDKAAKWAVQNLSLGSED